MIYGIEGAHALNADIVINVGTDSYICKLDPTKVDRSADAAPIEEQPVWSIIFYNQIQEYDQDGEPQKIVLLTKYPNGSTAYNFKVSRYSDYNYQFRL